MALPKITGVKAGGKYVIGLIVVAVLIFGVKKFYLDAPKLVGESQTVQKFQLSDMVENPSLAANVPATPLPKFNAPITSGTSIDWNVMAWNAQFPLMYANGGPVTSEGSLFQTAGVNVHIIRQDDCFKTIAMFIKNAQDIKDNPQTVPLFMTFMGDGIPGFSVMMGELEKLGPDYTPIAFYPMGRSAGEDAFMGPREWKSDPQQARGKCFSAVERDGDANIVFKWASDNNIPVNVHSKYFDSTALNLIPASDVIDAGNKYITGYTEPREVIVNGKSTGKMVTVGVDATTVWTPTDVEVAMKKGGLIRLASTKEYTSQMPAMTIVLKKWAYDHRTEMENIIIALGQAGDQIRSFTKSAEFAAQVSAVVYGDENNGKDAAYWLKYYRGVEEKDATGMKVQLGGSKAFNLVDAANMMGLGEDHKDRYKVTYETFAGILAKFYPKEMLGWSAYSKIVDKSFMNSVISNHPELMTGQAIKQTYASEITVETSNKSVNIEFANGSDVISLSSYKDIDDIYNSATIAEGLKLGIYGHTNSIGSDQTNQPLSERRANAVANYLIKKGLNTSQIESKGYGSEYPLVGIDPTDGRNRRVEIVLGQ